MEISVKVLFSVDHLGCLTLGKTVVKIVVESLFVPYRLSRMHNFYVDVL